MGTLSEVVRIVCQTRPCALMAVVNVTPDSFFDGGKYTAEASVKSHIDLLLSEGADIIDVGAESTRPGARPVSAEEQIARASAAIKYAVRRGACVSIDTTQPEVARVALSLGAQVINDVSCLADSALARIAKDAAADLIIMHSRGSMEAMADFSKYDALAYGDIVVDVGQEWQAAKARALAEGLPADSIWFDPGLGFHKNASHSHELMARLAEFRSLGANLVLGASRKSFLGSLDESAPENRIGGSIAAALAGALAGAKIVRVHDVQATRQALLLASYWSEPGKSAENAANRGAVRLKWGDPHA